MTKIEHIKTESDKDTLTSELRHRPIIEGVQKHWVWLIIIAAGVLVVLFAGLFVYSRIQLNKVKKDLVNQQNDPTAQIREETKQLLDKVGKLMILPTGEQPTIATVTDLEKLKGQPFFEKAQIGDKVLIYTKASKAILYRPSTNIIIELAPLNTGNNTIGTPAQ